MILCAALKITLNSKEIVIPCVRHGDGFDIIHQLKLPVSRDDVVQGFIDTREKFYNRAEAYQHCIENHQLNMTTIEFKTERNEQILYSEDLY